MAVEVRLLGPSDAAILARVAADVFDQRIIAELRDEFLRDPRHHLAVAIDEGTVVGMASAVHDVHPDKQPQLWINEVAVAPTHRKKSVGVQLVQALLQKRRELGCTEAWVLTDLDNAAAVRLYSSCGGTPREQVMFTFPLD